MDGEEVPTPPSPPPNERSLDRSPTLSPENELARSRSPGRNHEGRRGSRSRSRDRQYALVPKGEEAEFQRGNLAGCQLITACEAVDVQTATIRRLREQRERRVIDYDQWEGQLRAESDQRERHHDAERKQREIEREDLAIENGRWRQRCAESNQRERQHRAERKQSEIERENLTMENSRLRQRCVELASLQIPNTFARVDLSSWVSNESSSNLMSGSRYNPVPRPYPPQLPGNRPSQRERCRNHLAGICHRGDSCRYLH
jgi:hypothetical protein